MPSTATVQVRQTTTTTTSRASVVVINTGYLTTKLGILKLLLAILTLIVWVLVLLEAEYVLTTSSFRDYREYYWYRPSDQYLILVSFANFYAVTLMLIAALLSLGTASILPKTSFDFIFHIVGCILFLVGGIWVAIGAFKHDTRSFRIKVACILSFFCSILHLVHGVFSYRLCITN